MLHLTVTTFSTVKTTAVDGGGEMSVFIKQDKYGRIIIRGTVTDKS